MFAFVKKKRKKKKEKRKKKKEKRKKKKEKRKKKKEKNVILKGKVLFKNSFKIRLQLECLLKNIRKSV